jgi:predicted ribosome quality control (RQC) complex YloA/Tae2 family protein
MLDPDLIFDTIDLQEVPVQIAGKHYTLREASGEAARRYRNALLRSAKLGPDGKPVSLDGMADAEMILVNECLIDRSGRKTPIQVLGSWPANVIKKLFNKAYAMSDLKEGEEDTIEGLRKRKERLEKELDETKAKLAKLQPEESAGNGEDEESDRGGKSAEVSGETDPTGVLRSDTTAG